MRGVGEKSERSGEIGEKGKRISRDSIGEKERSFSEVFLGKEYGGLNWKRKLGTEERRVAGKSPGHGAKKGDFQV